MPSVRSDAGPAAHATGGFNVFQAASTEYPAPVPERMGTGASAV